VCVCACVCARVCVCARARVCVCVCVCVQSRTKNTIVKPLTKRFLCEKFMRSHSHKSLTLSAITVAAAWGYEPYTAATRTTTTEG
jgi:hypothetical protein